MDEKAIKDVVKVEENWKAPEEGWYKINCDGGFKKESDEAGIGVVMRNAEGKLVDGYYGKVKADSVLVVEAKAVKRGVKLAIEKNYHKVIVKMDSKIVHDEIVKEKMEINWRIWPLIRDIRRMLEQMEEKKVKIIRRNANRAADWVALQAKRGMCNNGWILQPPSSLVHILNKEGLPAPH